MKKSMCTTINSGPLMSNRTNGECKSCTNDVNGPTFPPFFPHKNRVDVADHNLVTWMEQYFPLLENRRAIAPFKTFLYRLFFSPKISLLIGDFSGLPSSPSLLVPLHVPFTFSDLHSFFLIIAIYLLVLPLCFPLPLCLLLLLSLYRVFLLLVLVFVFLLVCYMALLHHELCWQRSVVKLIWMSSSLSS